jgi:hypothetical protein
MVQVDKMREKYANDGGSLVASYNKNIDVTTTDSYAVALDIDSRGVRESVIVIHNTDPTNSIDYDVWANPDIYPAVDITGTAATDYDNGWVLIGAETSIAAGAVPVIETLSNPYSRVVVRIKATVASNQGVVRLWHRGEN